MNVFFEKIWYGKSRLKYVLYPASLLFQFISTIRKKYLKRFQQSHFSKPIIVVGNLTVGGAGKTPLVIALTKQLTARGLRVGVVSRGYKAKSKYFPLEVSPASDASLAGDEPVIIAEQTGCPVIISPKRVDAVNYLIHHHNPDIIISDDGLQHYKMGRAIEIIVIDAARGFGNHLCLPAGPLRESVSRLNEADFLIYHGDETEVHSARSSLHPKEISLHNHKYHTMSLIPGKFTQLKMGWKVEADKLQIPIAAIAGIGHPQRFFDTLTKLDVSFTPYIFKDHYLYQEKDLEIPEKTLVMTEKDAVKCRSFANDSMYFLPVEAKLCDAFWNALWSHEQLQDYFQ